MDIQVLGAWGEFLGGVSGLIAAIAVVGSLIFVGLQLRQNTKSLQSACFSTHVASVANIHASHMQAVDVLPRYIHDPTVEFDLESVDYLKFHGHATQVFAGYEVTFLFHQEGNVDAIYFESKMNNLKFALAFPGFRRWWDDYAPNYLDARFVAYVNNLTIEPA